jgi:hypothetical protein
MDNQDKQATLVTQDTGQTIGSKYALEKTERQSRDTGNIGHTRHRTYRR